jgi:hypothetical protein
MNQKVKRGRQPDSSSIDRSEAKTPTAHDLEWKPPNIHEAAMRNRAPQGRKENLPIGRKRPPSGSRK